jgi:hypothetical protein
VLKQTSLQPTPVAEGTDEEATQPLRHSKRVRVASGEQGSGGKLNSIVVRCNSFLL